MSDSVDRVFIHALQTVRKLPRSGSARPPPQDRLRLYGLYKQAMEGDVLSIMPRPVPADSHFPTAQQSQSLDPSSPTSPASPFPQNAAAQRGEIEKWDAWHACAGMSRTEAKRRYIDYLIGTMKKYACSTREGRELVGELEFVWDQIKSNVNNSHSGSGSSENSTNDGRAPRPRTTRATPSRTMSSLNAGLARSGVPSGQLQYNEGSPRPLRVLSPVSRGDGGDISGREEDENEEKAEQLAVDSDETGGRGVPTFDPLEGNQNTPASDRKWRLRMESALSRLTVEVAALREQLIDSRVYKRRRRGYLPQSWTWLKWLLWTAMRQIMFDLLILSFAILWYRWKGDRKLEGWIRQHLGRYGEKIKALLPKPRIGIFGSRPR